MFQRLISKWPIGALSVSTLLWAVTGWCISESTLTSAGMLGARGIVGLVCLIALLKQFRTRPSALDLLAGVSGALITWFYFLATRSGNGAADLALGVLYTSSIWTVVLERVFLKKKHPRWYGLAALVAAIGVCLLSTSWEKFNLGLLLYGLAGAFSFAIMLVSTKCEKNLSDRGLLLGLIVGVIIGFRATIESVPIILSSSWEMLLVVLAGVAAAGAYLLLTRTIRDVPPTAAAIIQSGEVPLLMLCLWMIGKREPTEMQMFGMVLVFASCLTIAIHMSKSTK